MNLTGLLKPIFDKRIVAARNWERNTEAVQRGQLAWLLSRARSTAIGEEFGFGLISDYETFASRVPLMPYERIRPMVMRMVDGARDQLWPGVTRRFAQSSGTSDGRSKYIPVTDDSLRRCHYAGGRDVVAHYLDMYPDSRIFSGRSFILGGSFANELKLRPGVRVGDLSANLIDAINPLVNLVRIPSKRIALMTDWAEKLPALVEAASHCDVTNISGVPSWFLTVLKGVLEHTGATTIHDVWPRLEVFFHGGISFDPYREQYRAITDPARMRYVETYNASEGFFAVQDSRDSHDMLMLMDAGVFYEFMPVEDVGSPEPRLIPAWKVEAGRTYALVITACNGLWRYPIGDTVEVRGVDPVRIVIAGRTKCYINAFGEELMVHNAEAAMARTCAELDCAVADYTAAPVYAGDRSRGRHEWMIEFSRPPVSVEEFADRLDLNLQAENSDYQAKRSHGLFLDRLSVVVARHGLFDDWLASTGKLGGQRKVPRLSNDRILMQRLISLNEG
ncbi:MAG: GH3 auxin-responsive promoter family protein [Muribaculaceae bacterium]|nr:GH3 auxin-responsive promoter family protein [Muribaculaceae bacterium]